ncbi:DoxX family protein [uncultured Streptomyces sp.]|uniref:DoxX family protein n=1 Tax=uncultured Streptomyces sp. TaxID=174707 RepID=UPI002620E06C|nr:DoxX family protein [uncultured Streptomyces sp.]
MFTLYVILAVLMSAVLLASARAKFTRPERLVDQMSTLGLSYRILPFLGVVQVAGAAGLVVGLGWGALGVAAAAGLTLYFAGAVAAHLRAGDYRGAPPAAVLTAAAVALVVLRAAAL